MFYVYLTVMGDPLRLGSNGTGGVQREIDSFL